MAIKKKKSDIIFFLYLGFSFSVFIAVAGIVIQYWIICMIGVIIAAILGIFLGLWISKRHKTIKENTKKDNNQIFIAGCCF